MTALYPLGYLGPEGSNSHQAALGLLSRLGQPNNEANLQPYSTIMQLFQAVQNQVIPSAIVPVENGIQGSVTDVLEAMMASEQLFQVIADGILPIEHALIHRSPEADLTAIRTVISHPQALGQCRAQIQQRLGDTVYLQTAHSTSEAVQQLSSLDASYAAIGTPLAARRYNAHVLLANLSDVPNNQTRFMWISHPDRSAALANSVDAHLANLPVKTTLCIGMNDRPGCLVDMLLVFKAYGLNMTRIESRPSKKQLGQYYFYIDVDTDLTLPAYERVWMYLNADSNYLRCLGPYRCLGQLPVASAILASS